MLPSKLVAFANTFPVEAIAFFQHIWHSENSPRRAGLIPQTRPTAFLSPNLQTRGAVPSTRRTLPALRGAHRRPSPQNRTTRQGATRPSPPPSTHGKHPAAILSPNLQTRGAVLSTRWLKPPANSLPSPESQCSPSIGDLCETIPSSGISRAADRWLAPCRPRPTAVASGCRCPFLLPLWRRKMALVAEGPNDDLVLQWAGLGL